MKQFYDNMRRIIFLLVLVNTTHILSAQHIVFGKVYDASGEPLPYANVFLKESLEGTSGEEDGSFQFDTGESGEVTLCVRMLGYENWEQKVAVSQFQSMEIRMKSANVALDDVEVIASTFVLKGSSQWKKMDAVDLVTTGGSNGDLYASISNMPGTQMAGENGRLFIRGGESREAQTYIDDLHVLVPYTTTGSENTPVRGRYSPFMFDGMTFSLGGYDPEYGQGLSSVLPLSTKDVSSITKTGVNISTVGLAGGGTQSFDEGSVSLNIDYQNLGPYFKVVPNRTDWIHPYQKLSGSTQLRYNPSSKTVAKIYGAYDYTTLTTRDEGRKFDLDESNYYLNGTFRHQTDNGYKLFGGAAFSLINQQVKGAVTDQDHFRDKQWELHIKAKGEKRFSGFFKWQLGAETMVRSLDETYRLQDIFSTDLTHSINSLFTTGTFSLTDKLSSTVSARTEYTSANNEWNLLPRITLNYQLSDISLSAIAGRYTQLTYNDYLLRQPGLTSESCWHYILGAYHQSNGRVYRLELYDKEYDKLAREIDERLDASGYGYSRGVDLFFNDVALFKKMEIRASYSLNFAKRLYRDTPVVDVPQYATRHNASLSLRYDCTPLKSIIGLTNRYASGRPYHDPNETGWMNKTAPAYNSLDLSWTFLVNPKLIIFASASNILGRKEIYNYNWSETPGADGQYTGSPVRANADNFFFIGVFITLGGNAAYDVSNF